MTLVFLGQRKITLVVVHTLWKVVSIFVELFLTSQNETNLMKESTLIHMTRRTTLNYGYEKEVHIMRD